LLYDVLSCLDRENILIRFLALTLSCAAIDTLYGLDGSTHAKITDPNRIQLIQSISRNAILSGGAAKSQ